MQKSISIPANEIESLKEKLIEYARENELACILDSNTPYFQNTGNFSYNKYDIIAGFSNKPIHENSISEFIELQEVSPENSEWYLGYLSYDLKNSIESLQSNNSGHLDWPDIFFFTPEVLFLMANGVLTVTIQNECIEHTTLFHRLNSYSISRLTHYTIDLYPRITKNEYLRNVGELQQRIRRGDIYEINFCQEFYNHAEIDPYAVYRIMNESSPSPFSAFFKYNDKFLLSASPERFLKKENSLIISQPMKGTSAKGVTISEDHKLKTRLSDDIKEQAENIMIVDLVRNDLSRIAQRNSVHVEELCGIYTFPHIHQMISTITAQLKTNSFIKIISATFPMGSMTGAPKIEAMKLIEQYESVKRGLYSGAVGYISPEMNFDFNVVIRSLQYNSKKEYLSYMVGGAITALSQAEKEYEECLAKVYGVIRTNKRVHYA
ncbi:MAG: aminodeoxychorismate synthase component I [Bacteroidales bacterium]|nr:aminodeoxychorismate synthase component I [Bacteroidales bacterium]